MLNKVVLVGNLCKDIELRYTSESLAIGASSIAVTRKFSVNGQKREETCFIDITFFGKQAEIAHQYLQKGSKLLIEGRLRLEQWQDSKSGQNRSKHSVAVESMEMLGEPKQGANETGASGASSKTNSSGANSGKAPQRQSQPNEYYDDEMIPF